VSTVGKRLSAALKKTATLVRLPRTKLIKLGGSTYRIRGLIVNELVLQDGTGPYEPWLDVVLSAALTCRPGTFLDVGANIGQTMLKLLTLDRTRPYVGFEPQIACCSLIQQFIEDNHLENHTVLPLGLSDKTRVVKLHIRDMEYDNTATIVEGFRPDSFYKSHQYVCVRKGDEVMNELGTPCLSIIKIDAEGAELEVIKGLSRTIQEQVPFIIFEVLNSYLVATGEMLDEQTTRFRQGRIEQLERILREWGYNIYNALPGNVLKKIRKIQPAVSADYSVTNYIAVPNRDGESFLRAFTGSVQDF
jgi:FkbM family methyltransferase